MAEQRILQMIPATGWQAVYVFDDGIPYYCDLVCWALVEEDGGRHIIPMESDGDGLVDEAGAGPYFVCIKDPSTDKGEVEKLCAAHHAKLSAKKAIEVGGAH